MTLSRRTFTQLLVACGGGLLLSSCKAAIPPLPEGMQGTMPEESAPHKRTWMAFIASRDIWEERQIPEVQRNLLTVAQTIAKYEPVTMLVRERDYEMAAERIGEQPPSAYPIDLVEFEMNDLWMRDTGPTFVVDGDGGKTAVNFNFNGWGEDQTYALDAKIADFVAQQAGAASIRSTVTLEGGCFEVDGQGTAIMTESCILNDNRNPDRTKQEVEAELKALLGLDKIIWLKGIKGKDITDGHTDFYARFAKPGVVVVNHDTYRESYDYEVTRENIELLRAATDAQGDPLELVILDTPWTISTKYGTENFAAGYVGYYVCNNAVIMQKFGDAEADAAAKAALTALFPDHHIEQLAIDGIASGGGSIHCTTQQEPVG
jgi:agmatine deiminase